MKKKIHRVFAAVTPLCAAAFSGGCSNAILLHPQGPVGDAERFVIAAAFALMLVVVIPVFVMALWFSWKYRASNLKAIYLPKWGYSAKIDLAMWLVPVVIVTALGMLAWSETHRVDPFKPIEPGVKPISIEVVALDWKWLFIYPDHNIAAVNQLVFPAKVPLSFIITSDTVMCSFFIPQLGSQIYAMAGRQSRLHLLANEPGTYSGQNQQFSGQGFSDMNFKAIATSREEFESWVQKARQSPNKLDPARYEELEKPGSNCPVTYFSSIKPGLFDHIVSKYTSMGVNPGEMSKDPGSMHVETTAPGGR